MTVMDTAYSQPSQLLVLGNGFDLECGLASSFSDFMEWRRNDIGKTCSVTVWDAILREQGKRNWYDIEKLIADWVTDKKRMRRQFGVLSYEGMLAGPASYDRYMEASGSQSPVEKKVSGVLSNKYDVVANVHDVYKLFMRELQDFESIFTRYLEEEVDAKNDMNRLGGTPYYERAARLLDWLDKDTWQCEEIDRVTSSILDFNYTDPTSYSTKIKYPKIVNVHGRIHDSQSSIIFGIDANNRQDDIDVAPFTKTYRLLSLRDPGRNGLISPATAFNPEAATEVIKFYGHSLGEADWSYFQSIFDEVNLYAGHTKLIFYYKKHGAVDWPDAEREMDDKVTRIISRYGKTMDNKDHGSNLMHKLLLEGRLMVKPYEP